MCSRQDVPYCGPRGVGVPELVSSSGSCVPSSEGKGNPDRQSFSNSDEECMLSTGDMITGNVVNVKMMAT